MNLLIFLLSTNHSNCSTFTTRFFFLFCSSLLLPLLFQFFLLFLKLSLVKLHSLFFLRVDAWLKCLIVNLGFHGLQPFFFSVLEFLLPKEEIISLFLEQSLPIDLTLHQQAIGCFFVDLRLESAVLFFQHSVLEDHHLLFVLLLLDPLSLRLQKRTIHPRVVYHRRILHEIWLVP